MKITNTQLNKYYRYAIALTGNGGEAFDIVHETLLRVQRKNKLENEFYTYRAIKNTFLNTRNLKDNQSESLTETLHSEVDLEKVVGEKFDVEKMMSSLSIDERELIFLIEVEGFTYKELEKILGIRMGTLLSKAHRAKRKLAEWGESYGK